MCSLTDLSEGIWVGNLKLLSKGQLLDYDVRVEYITVTSSFPFICPSTPSWTTSPFLSLDTANPNRVVLAFSCSYLYPIQNNQYYYNRKLVGNASPQQKSYYESHRTPSFTLWHVTSRNTFLIPFRLTRSALYHPVLWARCYSIFAWQTQEETSSKQTFLFHFPLFYSFHEAVTSPWWLVKDNNLMSE